MLGVIQENPFVARSWAAQIGTTQPVLSDWKGEVAQLYGVWDAERHMVKRTTLTIDGQGIIRSILQDRAAMDVDPGLEICRLLQNVASTAAP